MEMPKISNYGRYSSGNYGAHSLMVDIGPLRLWFSYDTIVAFADVKTGGKIIVRQNDWHSTTGKHLNWISLDKKSRLPSADFEAKLKEVLASYGLE